MKKVGANLTRAGRNLTLGITAPLIALGTQAVRSVAEFDSSMSVLDAAIGASDKQMERLRGTAIKLGADTVFSAGEAAEAMLELGKAGFNAAQISQAVPEVMNLAATEGLGLADSAGIVSAALSQFNLKAGDAGQVVNALAGASTASRASVGTLAESLKLVGSAASGIGLSVQETSGALAALADAGLDGSVAGTSLAGVFNRLVPTTTKARNAMKDLNLDFTDAKGNFDSVDVIAGKLRETFKGMDAESRKIALGEIFGRDASTLAAVNALISTGAEGLRDYTKAASDTSAAQKLADARMEGLKGALEKMKGALETAAISFGTALKPAIIAAANFIGDLAEKFASLPPEAQTVIAVIAGIAAAIGPLLVVAGSMITAIGAIAGVLGAVGLPVILVVAAIAALAAGLIYAYQTSETFREAVHAALAAVVEFVQTTVIPGLQGIADAFMRMVETVRPMVMALVAVIQQNMPQIEVTVRSVWSSVQTIITSAISIIQSVITIATAIIKGIWSAFGDDIMFVVRNVFPALANIIKGSFNIIAGIFKVVSSLLKGDWSGLWDGIKQILKGVWQQMQGVVRLGVAAILGILRALGGVVLGLFRNTWNSAKDQTTQAWNAIKSAVSKGVSNVLSLIRALPGKIKSALGNLGTLLLQAGRDVMNGLLQGIQDGAQAVLDKAGDIAGDIKDTITGALDVFSPSKFTAWVGEMLMLGLEVGIGTGGPKAVKAMVDQLTVLRDKTTQQLDGIRQEFTSLADSVAGAFTGDLFSATNASDFLTGLTAKYSELVGLRSALRKLKKWGVDPGFLAQLFSSGNGALILDLAEGTKVQARNAGSFFTDIMGLSKQLGQDVAKSVLGPKIDRTNERLDQIRDLLKALLPKNADRVTGTGNKPKASAAAQPIPARTAAAAPAAGASSTEEAVIRELQALRSEVRALTAVTGSGPRQFGQAISGVVADARVRAAG